MLKETFTRAVPPTQITKIYSDGKTGTSSTSTSMKGGCARPTTASSRGRMRPKRLLHSKGGERCVRKKIRYTPSVHALTPAETVEGNAILQTPHPTESDLLGSRDRLAKVTVQSTRSSSEVKKSVREKPLVFIQTGFMFGEPANCEPSHSSYHRLPGSPGSDRGYRCVLETAKLMAAMLMCIVATMGRVTQYSLGKSGKWFMCLSLIPVGADASTCFGALLYTTGFRNRR